MLHRGTARCRPAMARHIEDNSRLDFKGVGDLANEKVSDGRCAASARERTDLGSEFFAVWGALLRSILPTIALPVFYSTAAGQSASITEAGQRQNPPAGKSDDR